MIFRSFFVSEEYFFSMRNMKKFSLPKIFCLFLSKSAKPHGYWIFRMKKFLFFLKKVLDSVLATWYYKSERMRK